LLTDTQTYAELKNIAKTISTWHNISIYTDGSLEKYKHGETAMGIGIVFLQQNQEITFSAQTTHYPSSTRAEIMAILIALTLVPKETDITIFTDSQCAIEILKFKKPKTKRWNTSANPITIQMIQEIIKDRTGQTKTIKVAGHTGDKYNEMADKLAKISEPHNYPGKKIILPNHIQLKK